MKAALLRELNALLSVEDVDLEGPRSGEVRVEIVGAGVCHSDHHSIIGRNPPYALPTILGHEGAGTVTDVGPNVEGISGGVDYAFEVIGSPLAIRQAFESVRPGGTAVAVGVPPEEAEISVPAKMLFMDRGLLGSFYGSGRPRVDFPWLIDLYLDGRLKLDELITRYRPLEEVNEAFDDMVNGVVARTVLLPR